MRTAGLGLPIICGVLAWSGPASAVLVEKILAVVNGELLTLQDFEDHLALGKIYQTDAADVDRQQAFQRFVDQALLRQEALRTRIVQIGEDEVSQHVRELGQRPDRGQELARVMQERGLSQHDVRTWIRHQLIVRDFIDRRVRPFIRIPESQIVQYYQDHQRAIGEPLDEAIRGQIGRLLAERQVNVRLTELLGELRKKGSLDFPP